MKSGLKKVIQFRNECTFILKDSLNHELFWWPQTLVTYNMDFSSDNVSEDNLLLYDLQTNMQVPFQLSEVKKDASGRLLFSKLSFMTDLAKGEEKRFRLEKGIREQFDSSPIKVIEDKDSFLIDNGVFSTRIPCSEIYPVKVPGPIMEIKINNESYGNSELILGGLKILEIITECTEYGNLFADFQVKYIFDEGKSYCTKLRFIKGMEFFEFSEETENIPESQKVYFRLNWSGLAPTHRQAPNNPPILFSKGGNEYENYNWSKIDEPYVSGFSHPMNFWSNKENGEIPFRLSLYEPQATIVRVNSAVFWNENSGRSIGTFILDEEAWDDKKYDLFCSWDGFAISFFYKNGLLWWNYPIISGTRKTAITVYDHIKDKEYFYYTREKSETKREYLKGGTGLTLHSTSYCVFLQNRYSLLSLDKIKDYVLEYPENAKRVERIFDRCSFKDYKEFEHHLMNYILVSSLPLHGQRQNAGFSPVPYRRMTKLYAQAYNIFKDEMPYENRKRIEAMLLLLTYLAAEESVVPLINMLGGPPNLLGDLKRTLAYTAVLFPEHPEAERWRQLYGKFIEISFRLCTRPDLKGLRLVGGRWAENLGTYTWAFLVPALKSCMLLEKYCGERNMIASKYAALLGRWLVHSLTAPFEGENEASMKLMMNDKHFWGCFSKDKGPHRVHLPLGAHAARRALPDSMRDFAQHLERFDPILSENIHYVCADLGDDFEFRNQRDDYKRKDEKDRLIKGTRPEFKSMAFTGFGIMLRNGVYTPQEISVFLQQIDEGPNYRWGTVAAGGNGNIYYYAEGKAYSHNGLEDAGDRRINDCDVGCNFGVWKNGTYRSIGRNIITGPCHFLGTFQYASIKPEKDDKSYSYPEYQERNVLLCGSDYISIYDITGAPTVANRFSWSVSSFDKMPEIHILTRVKRRARLTLYDEDNSIDTVWYEGSGDCFAIVSHREDLDVVKTDYGAKVSSAEFQDVLIRSGREMSGIFEGNINFTGTVGAIRKTSDQTEVALIEGYCLDACGVKLRSLKGKTAISVSVCKGTIKGSISCISDDKIEVSYENNDKYDLYIDSIVSKPDHEGLYKVSSGNHTLELVEKGHKPTPEKPVIENVVTGNGCCEVLFNKANGAEFYEVEISDDYCCTWKRVAQTTENSCKIENLTNGNKYFVRVRGVNSEKSGDYAHEYPVYPTVEKPLAPEGLDITILDEELVISWGKVLGANGYKLYKKSSDGQVRILYSGCQTNISIPRSHNEGISFYAVSATNLNGEGPISNYEINDDPEALQNFKPLSEMYFNRNSLYCHHPFECWLPHKFRDVPASYPDSVKGEIDYL